jgi:hypothetical protein
VYLKQFYILVLTLSVTACSSWYNPECLYRFNAGGLDVCSPYYIDPVEIEQVVRITQEEVQKYYPQVTNLEDKLSLNAVIAHFVDGLLLNNCVETQIPGQYICDDPADGKNFFSSVILVSYRDCLGSTALAHEILHSIEFFYMLYEDINVASHMTPHLFTDWALEVKKPVLDTVEVRVRDRLRAELPSCQ